MTATFPEDICALIYSFAYKEDPPETFCIDIACWKIPACARCNDEIWAKQFYTGDLEQVEKLDAQERRLIIASEKEVLQYIGDDESLSDFLEKFGHAEEDWEEDWEDYDHYSSDDYKEDIGERHDYYSSDDYSSDGMSD